MLQQVRALHSANPCISLSNVMASAGLKRTAAQNVMKKDLGLNSLQQVTMQRVKTGQAANRLELCTAWKGQMDSGYRLDPRKVFFTDEEAFHLGRVAGGNQNYRVWVTSGTKKRDVPLEKIKRQDGATQGGVSVMVAMGACWHGMGRVHFVAQHERLNAHGYLAILENVFALDLARLYGNNPYIFQQDGASAHTSIVSQQWRRDNLAAFWAQNEWPACSPDLNLMDYFVWGWMQRQVEMKRPTNPATLKTAIADARGEMPLDMLQRAVDSWCKRVAYCVLAGGMQFKHMLGGAGPHPRPPLRQGDSSDANMDGRDDELHAFDVAGEVTDDE